MPYPDPTATESYPTFWDAIPLDEAAAPRRGADAVQYDDAYAAFLAVSEDGPVSAPLSVEQTDVG